MLSMDEMRKLAKAKYGMDRDMDVQAWLLTGGYQAMVTAEALAGALKAIEVAERRRDGVSRGAGGP